MHTDRGTLAGVAIYVVDLDRSVAFYREALGLAVVEEDDDFIVLSRGANELNLVAVPPDVASSIQITTPPEVREETPIKPSFLVDSIDAAAAAAVAAGGGAKPVGEAWEFRGKRHLDGFDPEGNVVQFVERLRSGSRDVPAPHVTA